MKPLWAGFLLCLSLCLDLGIVNVAVLRTSLSEGGTAGFLVGLGSCVGDLVYFTLAVSAAAALLQWSLFRWALWVFGTCILLVLAWRMAREVIHPKKLDLESAPRLTARNHFSLVVTGVGLALASPTAILWFAAIGGAVIASLGGKPSLWEFALGFVIAGVLWSGILAFTAAALRTAFNTRLSRSLSFVSGLLFLYFAVVVFVRGIGFLH